MTSSSSGENKVWKKLSEQERERYTRNMLLKEWNGEEGQLKLKNTSVLVVGAGGSGSPLLYYLAAVGIGQIRVCDGDKIELHNLNRQILHNTSRVGMNKARSAYETLSALNPEIEIIPFEKDLTDETVEEIADGCHVICSAADARDDSLGRKVIHKYACETETPVIFGGANNWGGVLTDIMPPITPCIECFLHFSDESLKKIKEGEAEKPIDSGMPVDGPLPIIGAACGIAGSLQALETVRCILGVGKQLVNRLLLFQICEDMAFTVYDISKSRRPNCPYCNKDESKDGD